MEKFILFLVLIFTFGFYHNIKGQTKSSESSESLSLDIRKGEKIFVDQADKSLTLIEVAANKMSVHGVAMLAYIPGDTTKSWISKMKVVGVLENGKANYLAIAYSKAAEMADTYKDSGSGVREPLFGEFGYQGGILKKVHSGYILSVFSGATGEQDVELAKQGINWLSKFY